MRGSSLEIVVPGKLMVIPSFLSSRQCRRFGKEIVVAGLDRETTETELVSQYKDRLGKTMQTTFSALGIVDGCLIGRNKQQPGYAQEFHTDFASSVIINYAGEGSFDYAIGAFTLEEASDEYASLPTGPGDVVIAPLTRTTFHRGRNTDSSLRCNLVLTGTANAVLANLGISEQPNFSRVFS